jgi:hypothetical protein
VAPVRSSVPVVRPSLELGQLPAALRLVYLYTRAPRLPVLRVARAGRSGAVGALFWRLSAAIAVEAFWEVAENSQFIIRRYREWTVAHGYNGDTIVNSFGDILACGLGFVLARQLGFRRAFAVFVLTEAVLIVWIRDSLLLNVLMLI